MTLKLPAKRRFDLIGLGECMVELRTRGTLATSSEFQRSYGGDVLNTLVTASRLGLKTAFVSRVGEDPFGEGLRREWQAEGVDVDAAPLVPGENGIYFIQVKEGEREFTYRRSDSAASHLTPQDVPETLIASSRALLISGITQAISATAQAATLHAAQLARKNGLLVAYDPNYRPKLWAKRGGLASAQAAFREVLPLTDLLLPSTPADDELLSQLGHWDGVQVVKCGADGALIRQLGHETWRPTLSLPVLDSTGAGDAFNAGVLSQLLNGLDLQQAVDFAQGVAGHSLRFPGAIPPRAAFLKELTP